MRKFSNEHSKGQYQTREEKQDGWSEQSTRRSENFFEVL
jgi:hypothetical protein